MSVRGYGRTTPYLFLAPYLVLFALFVAGPAVFGIWMSLHDWDFQLPGKPFVGLQNYKDLFDPLSTTAELFWHGMRATGIFTLASVPFLVTLPLALAVLLNREFPGRTFFRAVWTCRRLGIQTVAGDSQADARLPFVREADLAVLLLGNTPAETYLRGDLIIYVARKAGADATTRLRLPSENADFACSVIDAESPGSVPTRRPSTRWARRSRRRP